MRNILFAAAAFAGLTYASPYIVGVYLAFNPPQNQALSAMPLFSFATDLPRSSMEPKAIIYIDDGAHGIISGPMTLSQAKREMRESYRGAPAHILVEDSYGYRELVQKSPLRSLIATVK